MIAEIIFFSALALFIILLARKYHMLDRFPSVIRTAFSWLKRRSSGTSSISKLGSGIRQRLVRERAPGNEIQSEQGFWSEESPESKHDLPNQYEHGDSLLKAGKLQQAEQFFLKAAANHPSDPKIYARLGLLYLQQKNHSDAIESLKVAAKLDRYNPSRHYNLALAYWGNKDVQRAIMSVREAISLDPVTPKYRQLLEQLLDGK
jgi:tetratricopeptide (TPR) repeat protein